MKRLAAVFALSALAAATVGLAQQATQQTQTPPPPTTSQPNTPSDSTTQPTAPSDPGASQADKQALMKDCIAQVQAANPTVSSKEIEAYCDEQVKKMYQSKPE